MTSADGKPPASALIVGEHKGPVRSVIALAHGTVVSAGEDAHIKVWQPGASRPQANLPLGYGYSFLAALPDRTIVVSDGSQLWLWEPKRGETAHLLGHHHGLVDAVLATPEGTVVAGGSDALSAWDPATGSCRWSAMLDSYLEASLALRNGDELVIGTFEGVRLCDIGTGKLTTKPGVRSLLHAPDLTSVAVSSRGAIASGDAGGAVRIYETVPGTRGRVVADMPSAVEALTATADGRIAVGCRDGTIGIVDLSTEDKNQVVGTCSCPVLSLAITPDGRIVSGDNDGRVCLWSIPTR